LTRLDINHRAAAAAAAAGYSPSKGPLAVKVWNKESAEISQGGFLHEAEVLHKSHDVFPQVAGYYSSATQPAILYERCNQGNLEDLLR
jgi:hypothetical protein